MAARSASEKFGFPSKSRKTLAVILIVLFLALAVFLSGSYPKALAPTESAQSTGQTTCLFPTTRDVSPERLVLSPSPKPTPTPTVTPAPTATPKPTPTPTSPPQQFYLPEYNWGALIALLACFAAFVFVKIRTKKD